jgi:hypothetical protein
MFSATPFASLICCSKCRFGSKFCRVPSDLHIHVKSVTISTTVIASCPTEIHICNLRFVQCLPKLCVDANLSWTVLENSAIPWEVATYSLRNCGWRRSFEVVQNCEPFYTRVLCIIRCKPVARQRPRKKQLYNSRYWVTASQTSMFARQKLERTAEERCVLCGPCRGFKSRR